MRGEEFDYKKIISEMKLLDKEIIELPSSSEKFEKKYNKKFTEKSVYSRSVKILF